VLSLVGLWRTGCAAALAFAPGAEAEPLTPPAGTFLQVSIGNGEACAVRTDHTLACWGFLPPVPPAGSFSQVGMPSRGGQPFACAIRTDHTLVCFGTLDPATGDAVTPPAGTFSALLHEHGERLRAANRPDHRLLGLRGGPLPAPGGHVYGARRR